MQPEDVKALVSRKVSHWSKEVRSFDQTSCW